MINVDKKLFLPHFDNVIAITSGVGSMGKTWFSLTLSHAMNTLSKNILLVDCDNGVLNMGFQLGLENKPDLSSVVHDELTVCQARVPLNRKKFDVLNGKTGSFLLENMPIGRLQVLHEDLQIIANNYDYVLFDAPPSELIMQHLIAKSAMLILVCTNDPSNLVATYNYLKDIVLQKQYKSLQIVVNYANSYEEGLQTYGIIRRACEQYIKETPKLLGVVRRDTRVRDAIRNHVLLLNRYPNSEAAEDVMQIAHNILKTGEIHDNTE